jgi:hypothetical protein
MKIAFHTNQLSLRGTEVAMYDYAKYNEEILKNESIIISKDPSIWNYSHPLAEKKFKDRFKVLQYKNFLDVEPFLNKEQVDVFYAQKTGINDGIVSLGRKTVIHMVFQNYQPHGDVYAAISKWLGNRFNIPYVPYMLDLPNIEGNLRQELGIPENAIVFGRHGGAETFDILFVKNVVKEIIKTRNDIYFLFMYTNKFVDSSKVIHLDGNQDLEYKTRFINTCDAMLHARTAGETFGLAVAEFSIRNKPIITFGGLQRESAHLQMLGNKAIKYFYDKDLKKIINDFTPKPEIDWNAYRDYVPEIVMNKFKEVFLT